VTRRRVAVNQITPETHVTRHQVSPEVAGDCADLLGVWAVSRPTGTAVAGSAAAVTFNATTRQVCAKTPYRKPRKVGKTPTSGRRDL